MSKIDSMWKDLKDDISLINDKVSETNLTIAKVDSRLGIVESLQQEHLERHREHRGVLYKIFIVGLGGFVGWCIGR